eukprot:gnl/TRDRNA2_/TRDRNA2_163894_c0_seq1.p1 gnl/TRDRNA2_/TRDRNA2_163894_c0~~gnl/TRDRNA2_/TRDRNA2_163894_c0_seq1.p1  ORF type:complete len:303 (-),score=39.97 gnl/TRDRNA2_/TRDRNA2_163894_c0_seq1:69-923(-)
MRGPSPMGKRDGRPRCRDDVRRGGSRKPPLPHEQRRASSLSSGHHGIETFLASRPSHKGLFDWHPTGSSKPPLAAGGQRRISGLLGSDKAGGLTAAEASDPLSLGASLLSPAKVTPLRLMRHSMPEGARTTVNSTGLEVMTSPLQSARSGSPMRSSTSKSPCMVAASLSVLSPKPKRVSSLAIAAAADRKRTLSEAPGVEATNQALHPSSAAEDEAPSRRRRASQERRVTFQEDTKPPVPTSILTLFRQTSDPATSDPATSTAPAPGGVISAWELNKETVIEAH